jgi:hypothetical protein
VTYLKNPTKLNKIKDNNKKDKKEKKYGKLVEQLVTRKLFKINKRAMMALDRSPDTTASKQCLKQAS